MAKIAFLGTGAMGSAMIRNYLKGGHDVTVYNRTIAKAKPLEEVGAKVAATPIEAAEGAEVVAGRPDLANAGKLKVFAGGAKDDVDAMRPVLDAISAAVIHFGPVGSGITFKLIYNVMGALQVAATAEGLLACEAAGIDLRVAADAFSNGATGSPHVKLHSKNMAEGIIDDPIMFTGKNRIKDTSYGIEVIDSFGAQSVLGRGTKQVWEQMVEEGMELRNDSELIDALRAAHKKG